MNWNGASLDFRIDKEFSNLLMPKIKNESIWKHCCLARRSRAESASSGSFWRLLLWSDWYCTCVCWRRCWRRGGRNCHSSFEKVGGGWWGSRIRILDGVLFLAFLMRDFPQRMNFPQACGRRSWPRSVWQFYGIPSCRSAWLLLHEENPLHWWSQRPT